MSKEQLDRFRIDAVTMPDGNATTEAHVDGSGEWAEADQAERAIARARAKAKRLKAELAEANAKIEQLAGMLANPELTAINIGNGSLDVGLRGVAPQIFAAAFARQFKDSGGINYVEMRMVTADPSVGELLVTLQRLDGKTPHQLRMEAEAALAEARHALRIATEENRSKLNEDHA